MMNDRELTRLWDRELTRLWKDSLRGAWSFELGVVGSSFDNSLLRFQRFESISISRCLSATAWYCGLLGLSLRPTLPASNKRKRRSTADSSTFCLAGDAVLEDDFGRFRTGSLIGGQEFPAGFWGVLLRLCWTGSAMDSAQKESKSEWVLNKFVILLGLRVSRKASRGW